MYVIVLKTVSEFGEVKPWDGIGVMGKLNVGDSEGFLKQKKSPESEVLKGLKGTNNNNAAKQISHNQIKKLPRK
ncbi:MAG: hypothetical protein HZT40_04150 [Candidatus Thiothrix singaporensis]|uniref:Uncharacterized protein n=1 Tax=Candidatus Thiothrix singaporensis TaxID=2799669 RepID=A0A7L6APB6_9GAMM|nr:MAG: hypothetical protein HZT40_04150 [Candidatus Thiothrix singaporensis]